jgi:AraC-like DNA-binding protein
MELAGLPAAERLDVWRAALGPVFEIAPDPAEDPAAFSGTIAMAHLGDALLSTVRSGPQTFERSRAHVRRSGLDHFMVQTFLHGRHDGACDENPVHRGQGDVWILDLARETKTKASHFANVTLVIPRDRVKPLLKGGDIHGTTLRHGTPSARLIASHLETLMAAAPELDLTEAAAAVDAAALMIAGAWCRIRESRAEVTAAVRATARRAICDYIDLHLSDERLTPEALVRLFHMSRATLYRLFEEEGGVAAYILGRRLDRCHAILAVSLNGECTIGEIAFGHGFVSEAHFSRAFRRRFGLAPRDARGTSVRSRRVRQGEQQTDSDTVSEWIATLRRHHLRLVAS